MKSRHETELLYSQRVILLPMSQPQRSGYFNGELYVSEIGDQHDRLDEGDVSGVVFKHEDMNLLFRSAIGGRFIFERSHIRKKDEKNVYYPHFNETTVEMNNPKVYQKTLKKVEEDVSVGYLVASDNLYVRSQVEVATYSPIHIVVNENLYAIRDPLLVEGGRDFAQDKFLGFQPSKNSVRVKNVQSGLTKAVDRDKIDNLINNNRSNGAIHVSDPENMKPVQSKVRDLLDI